MSALLGVVLIALGLFAVGGQFYLILSARARQRSLERKLGVANRKVQEQARALEDAESRASHLKEGPKADLLSMLQLTHELRSPLASIQSALDMLLQGYAANNQELQDEMLNLARERTATMLDQVNDSLRLGAIRHSEIERQVRPVQLLDVLKRLVPEKRVRARWRAVDFSIDVPESLTPVSATAEDMEHMLSNLINNAIKYTNPGGRVTVHLRELDHSVIGIVEDTGIGIAAEDVPRIFGGFYRTEAAKGMDAHGTGLGLTIVKRVADLYGGQLRVESEVGKGSKFIFTFPKTESAREPVAVKGRELDSHIDRQALRGSDAMEQKIKIFRELEQEVILKGLCGKCGGCVSFCSAGNLNALEMGADDLPRYADEKKCLACGICYMICPQATELDGELRSNFGWRLPIGLYQTVRSARATDEAVRQVATDGGVVTSLLLCMLDRHLIDGAIVSRRTSPFDRTPLIATTREELIAAAGSHFGGSAHLEELGDKYTTYSPTISAVKGLESRHLMRVAMVGTPCQIRSIRKMQCLGILPAHLIHVAIGLFCMENFAFDRVGRARLEQKLQISFGDITRLNVKEDVIVTLSDGRTLHVPFDQVDEVARPACLACLDFANDYADLSAGGLGSPMGYTTVLLRTDKGSQIYAEALSRGYLEERASGTLVETRKAEAEMVDKVITFAQRKRARGQARLREMGVEGGADGE